MTNETSIKFGNQKHLEDRDVMVWQEEMDELKRRLEMARGMGGKAVSYTHLTLPTSDLV